MSIGSVCTYRSMCIIRMNTNIFLSNRPRDGGINDR